jgi:filamentous hemagglutinin family protein
MNKFSKKLSALVLTAVFATMQVSAAIDTGLGVGNGGAVIDHTTGGFVGMDTGANSATLNFNNNTHVNWNTLNVNAGETLNFNATSGVSGITVLNTVNSGMSNIYGAINTNAGVGKLIISNPNGVLFDGAKFTTAGDAIINTDSSKYIPHIIDTQLQGFSVSKTNIPEGNGGAITIKNSDFSVGGDLNFVAPTMNIVKSAFAAKKGAGDVKFTTTNGQDYIISPTNCCGETITPVTALRMEAVQVDGNVYIVADKGIVKTVSGGEINGNLDIKSNSDYSVALNYVNNGKDLNVKGDTNINAKTQRLFIRNTKIDGNLNAYNDGGFIEIGNVKVGKDANLTTKKLNDIYNDEYNHFVHVIGNTEIGGDLNIDSAQNIHIGGYQMDENNPKIDNGNGTFYWNGKLLDGSLKVGGDLNAKTTSGHITTTVNTTAKNINYDANSTSDANRKYGGNILSDGKAVLTADTYQFKADGYIGGLKESQYNGKTVDNQIINIMESYTNIPADINSHDYLTINGGTVTKIKTPKLSPLGNDVQVYIKSLKDVTVNGADAGVVNLTAPKSKITITGDVHAKEINIGPETDYLKLDFPNRDFTTNFTSIRDEKVVTIKPNEEITYDLADGGYNQPSLKPGENTTYLIGPDKPVPPIPPEPPQPDPKKPTNDDNVRVKNWVPEDPMKPLVNTPVAFAADLDDDDEAAAVRKNVDGSVTVVRAFPMMGN